MNLRSDISLKTFNTFAIDVTARYFVSFANIAELKEAVSFAKSNNLRLLMLGGGSNMLFMSDFDGLVLHNAMKGMEVTMEDENQVYLTSAGGEVWHELVMHSINLGLGGFENLSLIPGTVGASPIQNIGAYGVELKDSFIELEAFSLDDQTVKTYTLADCAFGYRDSIFKRELKNKVVILSATFRLNRHPVLNTSYGAIKAQLQLQHIDNPTVRDVSNAVVTIRKSKLPDPAVIGNAGSFFKNPELPAELHQKLLLQHPQMPGYASGDKVKVAAGWLIEQCGWKGFRRGDAGCHAKQALVLVNYGSATGKEIFELSEEIMLSVFQKFGVHLEREVNVI